jgi:hypothetical protein
LGGFSSGFEEFLREQLGEKALVGGQPPRQTLSISQEGEEESGSQLSALLKEYDVILLGEKPLGSGNFGSVWRGLFHNRLAAVKVISRGKLDEMYLEVGVMRYARFHSSL